MAAPFATSFMHLMDRFVGNRRLGADSGQRQASMARNEWNESGEKARRGLVGRRVASGCLADAGVVLPSVTASILGGTPAATPRWPADA